MLEDNEAMAEVRKAIERVERARDEAIQGLSAYYDEKIATYQRVWTLMAEEEASDAALPTNS